MGSSGSLAYIAVVVSFAFEGLKPGYHCRTVRNYWPMNHGPSFKTFQ